MTYDIKIDPDFRDLLNPLSEEEHNALEASILKDGVEDPLKVWNGILVDGHNRLEICKKHGIENFPVKEKHFGSKSTDRFRPIPTALRIYNMCGRNRFDTVMNIATSAWGATTDTARAGLLSGIDLLLTTYGSNIDVEELIKSLSRVSPLKLCADAKADTLEQRITPFRW